MPLVLCFMLPLPLCLEICLNNQNFSIYKVNFKPFLFEAFLSHPIHESSSRCTISGDKVEFHLQKEEKNVNWTSLCALLSREEKKKAREEALNRVLIRLQEGSAAKRGISDVDIVSSSACLKLLRP